jgi:hypothetical protein
MDSILWSLLIIMNKLDKLRYLFKKIEIIKYCQIKNNKNKIAISNKTIKIINNNKI